ncbi:MAG: DUF1080 domain-containing protein [Planctomycetaceae bacterium]|nr:DUF1080 domain-containing protein [Planctomycetaceae bacterium]
MQNHWCLSLFASVMMASVSFAADDPKNPMKKAFLDAQEAGPDFAVQGEYAGKLDDSGIGVQVIAKGNGKFDAVVLPGGLPGAGWDGKGRHALSGKTEEGKTGAATILKGEGGSAVIAGDTLALTWGDKKADLKKLNRVSPTVGLKAPAGAIVLFDGSNVDVWEPGKMAESGLMGVGTRTKQKFDSFTLHLEFRTPFMPLASGQGRGNSGMYLQDQYECQILDSFGLTGEDNECGGIYKNARPSTNMCLPPLTWQTYDVEFTGTKFDAEGKVTAPGKCTIKHNGVIVHENLELKTTPGGGQANQKPGALFLQDHGDPVRFRNIWIVEK